MEKSGDKFTGDVEKASPKLNFFLTHRSESQISSPDFYSGTVEAMATCREYTIVLKSPNSAIRIYDSNAKMVPDLHLYSSGNFTVGWSALAERLNVRAITKHKTSMPDTISLEELSINIRCFAELKLSTEEMIILKNISADSEKSKNIHVSPNGKYIFLETMRGGFTTLATQDEQGILLPPKDWVRIDPYFRGTIPPDLEEQAKAANIGIKKEKLVGGKYRLVVTDIGINIVRVGETNDSLVFSEAIGLVENNTTIDPQNPNLLFYCQSDQPQGIFRLDLSGGDTKTWRSSLIKLPGKYDKVSDLQFDPTGNFLMLFSRKGLIILDKDNLNEVGIIHGAKRVVFGADHSVHVIDDVGHLVIYETNISELAQEIDKQRVARLAQGIQLDDIFDPKTPVIPESKPVDRNLEPFSNLQKSCWSRFNEIVSVITSQQGVDQAQATLSMLKDSLTQQGLKSEEINFVLQGIDDLIVTKETELINEDVRTTLASVQSRLAGNLSFGATSEIRGQIEKIKALDTRLEANLRQEVREVAQEFEQKSQELFQQRSGEITKDIQNLIDRTRTDLEGFTTKAQMDDWLEFRYPQLKSKLGFLARDIPLEAEETYKAILTARTELQSLADSFEDRFEREYAKVREKAAERTEATVNILLGDIDGLVARLEGKHFSDRKTAQLYLVSSPAKKTLEDEILALDTVDPELAKKLKQSLRVKISNVLYAIERRTLTQVAETGQQEVLFGQTLFPKWEAKVREKAQRQIGLTFDEDMQTHGPGVRASDILGDITVSIRSSTGKIEKVKLYEDKQNESEWKLGLLNYRGEPISPSYVTAREFVVVKREYDDWSKGERSQLKKKFAEQREILKTLYAQRQKVGERTPNIDSAWQERYRQALLEYSSFASEHHIPLLLRVDQILKAPEIEYSNGKGFVPEWQNHWVMDPQTQTDLEEMAQALKMQLDLQEGLLNLKGHAGTGKDVRIKMFCALTNRPYFGIDGTKWTTEFELSEDVMLESKGGASQTVKVPSAVLSGIRTPGAVVYFNEFNAMPEQAQIFLHALMDEKRSLTLKTSSGKTIRALPSVLLVSSMNPGYPGTFEPQFATRSRMVSLEIDYPPLTRKPDAADPNPNLPYDVSEALRVARSVDSLSDLTYEGNLEHNDFVKMWDHYVNGIDNDAQEPNGTQKFDIDTIIALIQFAHNLREDFIKIFEKSREARNALPVTQPITGRELRRAAYILSQMSPEEKATANPETVAKGLLARFFLTHIDKNEDRNRIFTAMQTWTSKKRMRI